MSDAPPKLTPDEWLGEFAVAAKKAGWKVHVELAPNHTGHDASSAEVETLLATIADQKAVIDQYSNDMVEIAECAEAAEVADAAEICGAIQLLQKRVQLAEIKKEELLSKAELRGVDGWHWVETLGTKTRFCRRWWKARGEWCWANMDDMTLRGLRYLAPVATPDTVRALVEALEGWTGALDAKREFERQNPGNSTKAWDNLFYAVEAAETTALAALARAKAEGLA